MESERKKRKIKIKEEAEVHNLTPLNQLQVGDLVVSSPNSLVSCERLVKRMLKDKSVKKYLSLEYPRKKLMLGVE